MRRIAHISDLHFGAVDEAVAEALVIDLEELAPDVILVSGDLTQRARASQFQTAQSFLDRLAPPKVIVPGNHDIPLYNVAARFGWPLAGYERYITENLSPTFADDELAIAGVNTARSNTWKDGRVSREQIEELGRFFCSQPADRFRILVAHHPFIPPPGDREAVIVGRAPAALAMLASCGCSLLATGHLHQTYSADARTHHVEMKQSVLVAQAGTAISSRRRGEPNAFNLFIIDGRRLTLEVRKYDAGAFQTATVGVYDRGDEGWVLRKPTVETG